MNGKQADPPPSIPPATAAGTGTSVLQALAPLTLAVFIAFLTIGLQLPVLPLHLKEALGMNATVVGVVVGAQFAAALLSRAWAGNVADLRGPKRAVVGGFVAAALSGHPRLKRAGPARPRGSRRGPPARRARARPSRRARSAAVS